MQWTFGHMIQQAIQNEQRRQDTREARDEEVALHREDQANLDKRTREQREFEGHMEEQRRKQAAGFHDDEMGWTDASDLIKGYSNIPWMKGKIEGHVRNDGKISRADRQLIDQMYWHGMQEEHIKKAESAAAVKERQAQQAAKRDADIFDYLGKHQLMPATPNGTYVPKEHSALGNFFIPASDSPQNAVRFVLI